MILIITFCALIGSSCDEQRIPLLREITPFMCAIKAQEHIASVSQMWDGYRVDRYRCVPRQRETP